MSKLLHLYCTLLFSAGLISSALSQEYHFQNFTELTGLPSSETYDVFQDRTGFIWIASDNGVVRYDGEEFVNFNSAQGLTDNTVFSFYEDKRDASGSEPSPVSFLTTTPTPGRFRFSNTTTRCRPHCSRAF
ncbi:MAG: two-component regulator propeller domain-containing protein [Bacteroidota bacterium]